MFQWAPHERAARAAVGDLHHRNRKLILSARVQEVGTNVIRQATQSIIN